MLSLKTMLCGVALSAVLLMPATAAAETFQEALISVYNSNPRLQAERARLREVDENYIQARAQGRSYKLYSRFIRAAVLRRSKNKPNRQSLRRVRACEMRSRVFFFQRPMLILTLFGMKKRPAFAVIM